MASTIDGGRAVWQWQYSTQGEQDVGAVGSTLRQYAGAGLCWMKAMDGSQWQSTYDKGPHAINSLATWKNTVIQGIAGGIDVRPWVVAQNAGQAAAHAKLGPCVMVDLEDDPKDYWNDSIPHIATYLQALRAGGVTEIHVAIDPRPPHVSYLNVAGWAHLVDGIHSQSYWPDFQTPALANVADVRALLALGVPVYPIVPYNGTAADLTAFWAACKQAGCKAVSMWRLGSATAQQLGNLAALDVSLPQPEPDYKSLYEQSQAALARTTAALQRIKETATAALTLA